jgi:hypothetical protein
MKKSQIIIAFITFIATSSLSFGATLNSMNKTQMEQAFINKTITSIATGNLKGLAVDNSNSVFFDDHGNILGKWTNKPADEPQRDKGVYSIKNDGTLYIIWQHWDGAKQICFHIFNTKNAYISVNCANVFDTAFIKKAIKSGNHLK